MNFLFGSAKEPEPKKEAPKLEDATAKIEGQVQNLEAKIFKADEEIKKFIAENKPTSKQRALQAMKRKKMYEQQRDQLLGTQLNLETLQFQQEQAEITVIAVDAMRAGADVLKAKQQEMNIDGVDKLTDDLAELQAEMQEINEALAAPALGGMAGIDDADLEAEFAAVEEEMAAMKLAGHSGMASADPMPQLAMPMAPPAPAQAVQALAAPAQVAANPQELLPGSPIVIFGLANNPALNGKTGKLQSFDPATESWSVDVEGEKKRVRPHNLQLNRPYSMPVAALAAPMPS